MKDTRSILAGHNPQFIEHGIRNVTLKNIRAGITAGFFNGVTVGVVTPHGREIISEGLLQACGREELQGSEIYDLASITKLFTTLLFHILHGQGSLDGLTLESHVAEHLSLEGPHVKELKVKHLLWFLTEFQASEGMSEMVKKGHDPIHLIKYKGLTAKPGHRWLYCNHSYTLLGLLIEHVTRRKLPVLMQREILDPLEMHETTFFPWELEDSPLSRFVPTENGLRGFVHDESARHLMRTKRQAVGSAGIFAPVADVLRLLAMLLDEGVSPKGKLLLRKRIVRGLGANCTGGKNESFGNGVGLYSSFCEGLEHTVSSEGAIFKGAFTGGQVVCAPKDKVGFAIFSDYLALGRRKQKGEFLQWVAKTGGDIITAVREK